MALQQADRVKETTTTTGTGALALGGAMVGFQAFSAVCSVGDTCYYAIQAVDAIGNPAGAWETGLGTYSSSNTLTRTTVLASSNAGAAVSFAAGTKQVWIDIPAAVAPITGALLNVRVFTSGTTYNSTAGTKAVLLKGCGGGGAGGGSPATGASQFSAGSGGGGGGYFEHFMTSGFNGLVFNVGAAGAGASGASGGTGGNTTVVQSGTTILIGNGGVGGIVAGPVTAASVFGSSGGTASGGNIFNVNGDPGQGSSISSTQYIIGPGGATPIGGAGAGGASGGGAASGYGAGGGGTAIGSSASATAGGNGAPGVIVVYEYR